VLQFPVLAIVIPASYSGFCVFSGSLAGVLLTATCALVFFWCSARRAGKFYELQSPIGQGEFFLQGTNKDSCTLGVDLAERK
jgi:hypothetical protein